jgi:hypothetical protein
VIDLMLAEARSRVARYTDGGFEAWVAAGLAVE